LPETDILTANTGALAMSNVVCGAVAALLIGLAPELAIAQLEEISFAPTNVTSFQYGGKVQRIWASLKNTPTAVKEWQFRYDPLFLPEADQNGQLVYQIIELPNRSFRIQIPIELDNGKARAAAFGQLSRLYNDKVSELQPANVFALNVGTLTISVPELEALKTGAKLVNATVSFLTQPDAFNIRFDVPNKEAIDILVKLIPTMRIDYQVSFNAKTAKQNVVRVTYKDLRNSKLYAVLNGLNSTEAYVHRDDLRKLTEDIHTQVEVIGVIEDPGQFDAAIYEKVLSVMTSVTNTATTQFDAQKWAATFNSDDLKPDVISKTLNKEFIFDQGSKQGKRSGSVDTGGKFGLLDILKAEGKFGGSFSTDDLQTWLKQHGVETSFEGNKIVVKSIELQRVNMAAFAQDSQFTSIVTLVSSGLKQENGSMDLDRLLTTGATTTPLPGRVAELELNVQSLRTELVAAKREMQDNSLQLRNKINAEFKKLSKWGGPETRFSQVFSGGGGKPSPGQCPDGSYLYYANGYIEGEYKFIFECKPLPMLELKE
jgi:hypothetical protein